MKTEKRTPMMRALAALFILLCASTLPVKAYDDYNFRIAGVEVTSLNCDNVQAPAGSNAIIQGVSYDHASNMLTLNNAIIDARNATYGSSAAVAIDAYSFVGGLVIRLIGKNYIYADGVAIHGLDYLGFFHSGDDPTRSLLYIDNCGEITCPAIDLISMKAGSENLIFDMGCDIDIHSNGPSFYGGDIDGNKTGIYLMGYGSMRLRSTNREALGNVTNFSFWGGHITMPRNAMWSYGQKCLTSDGSTPIAPKEVRIASDISINDYTVRNICIENWDENGDRQIDEIEARLVTSLDEKFKGNTQIYSFNELKNFTGIEVLNNDFEGCSSLQAVKLPDFVKTIGVDAFTNTFISTIAIPRSVETIDNWAFYNCQNLSSVTFEVGSQLKAINERSFSACPIAELELPNGVQTIGKDAFFGNRLTTLTIPSSVTNIGESAFWQNQVATALYEEIIVEGSSPATINKNVFGVTESSTIGYLNKNKTKIYVPSNNLDAYKQAWLQYKDYLVGETGYDIYIAGRQLTEHNVGPEKEYTYADDHTTVKGVYYNPQTETITLDNAVIKTTSLYTPAIEIGRAMHLWGTVDIELFGSNTIESAHVGILSYGGLSITPKSYNEYDLADMKLSIKSKSTCIFFDNEEISASPSLTMKYGSYELYSVNSYCIYGGNEFDPEDPNGFQASASFKNIKMRALAPDHQVMVNLRYYSDSFEGCRVVHPANYSTPEDANNEVRIGNWITFNDEIAREISVDNWDANTDGGLDEWEAAEVETIGTAFRNSSITDFSELRYFTGIKEIPAEAFRNCGNLQFISFPDNVVRIGDYAFNGAQLFCPNLPTYVDYIGKYAFVGCRWETPITIPYYTRTIEEGAFLGCAPGLWFDEDHQIEYQLETIGDKAFAAGDGNWGYSSVNIIPQNLKFIGSEAFSGCDCLQLTVYGERPATIGLNAFGQTPFSEDSESYIRVPEGTTHSYKQAWSQYKDYILGEDLIPTGISQQPSTISQHTGIYTLDGRCIRKDGNTQGLPKGLYIIDGKKVSVK